jgi:hypothetical protein
LVGYGYPQIKWYGLAIFDTYPTDRVVTFHSQLGYYGYYPPPCLPVRGEFETTVCINKSEIPYTTKKTMGKQGVFSKFSPISQSTKYVKSSHSKNYL